MAQRSPQPSASSTLPRSSFAQSETQGDAVKRLALRIEYNGTRFNGWQAQHSEDACTVQEEVEKALSTVADQPVRLFCAGRTDAGVHATAQIVHFDTDRNRPLKAWVRGVNTLLPRTVTIHWAAEVDGEFHARFSALSRRYCYMILNTRNRPAILNGLVTHYPYDLDTERMQIAANYLYGELDFTSYRGSNCQSRTPMRNVTRLTVRRQGDFVTVDIQANAFLLHMVRNIVGVLLEIGTGRKEPDWSREVLEARDRSAGAVTARPDGLYLSHVEYPQRFALPENTPVFPFGPGAANQ